jgi:biofilm PGA synthesis N-glycosyltransferase PgaC
MDTLPVGTHFEDRTIGHAHQANGSTEVTSRSDISYVAHNPNTQPKRALCVLIPAKDEALVIGKTIESIFSAGVSETDIYLIDDGSLDSTGLIALQFGINVLRNTVNLGKAMGVRAAAEHFGLTHAYAYIAMMDADTLVHKDYFQAVMDTFKANPSAAAVCGRPQSRPHNWITAYRCWEYYMTHFVYRGGQSNMGVIMVAPGCAATYRSDVFARLDWNNDTRVEDMDVTIQVHRHKMGQIIYAPRAVVYTQDPRTIRDFAKQILRWHSGTWQVGTKYRMLSGCSNIDLEFKLLMGEGLIFSMIFLAAPLWSVIWPTATVMALVVDALVIMAVSLAAAISDKRADVFLYSPLFIFLRIIYCSVFLYSFWNVIVRKQKMQGWLAVQRY